MPWICAGICAALLTGSAAHAAGPTVLVFTKTVDFRHDSIPAGVQAVKQLGAANGFGVDATEDAGAFTDANLARYRAVIFLNTTGDVLDDTQQDAFRRYLEQGGGFAGIHSAADTEHGWPWYGSLVGTFFASHPAIQQAVVAVSDPRGPGTAGLPARWTRTDEWYDFASNPRPSVHVLATLDESTYDPGPDAMGADHPIAWWHDFDGGRAWYTGMGHTSESYGDPLFLSLLLGGIQYAIGPAAAQPAPAALAIASLTATVHGRRVAITAAVRGCGRCSATARVELPGRRTVVTPLRLTGATARGTTPVLPPGRWQLVVSLQDAASGLSLTQQRPVRIR